MSKEPLRQVLAENVRKLRNAKGYSQEQLAELAGIHRTYTGMIERCESNTRLIIIQKLATALNTSIAVLLGAKTKENPSIPDIRALLAHNVKKYRLEKGYSQAAFSSKSGIGRSYIVAVERGRNIPIDSLEKLANGLEIPAYKLII